MKSTRCSITKVYSVLLSVGLALTSFYTMPVAAQTALITPVSGYTATEKGDCGGGDIVNVASQIKDSNGRPSKFELKQCADLCTAKNECQGFSYHGVSTLPNGQPNDGDANNKTCYLKLQLAIDRCRNRENRFGYQFYTKSAVSNTYNNADDSRIAGNPCYSLHAKTRFADGVLNKPLTNSDATDKNSCGATLEPYTCMNAAMRHCDTWPNESAKACGREMLRNGCLNSNGISAYAGAGIRLPAPNASANTAASAAAPISRCNTDYYPQLTDANMRAKLSIKLPRSLEAPLANQFKLATVPGSNPEKCMQYFQFSSWYVSDVTVYDSAEYSCSDLNRENAYPDFAKLKIPGASDWSLPEGGNAEMEDRQPYYILKDKNNNVVVTSVAIYGNQNLRIATKYNFTTAAAWQDQYNRWNQAIFDKKPPSVSKPTARIMCVRQIY